jgi:hypothetical protein
VRRGARDVLQRAIEAEVEQLLEDMGSESASVHGLPKSSATQCQCWQTCSRTVDILASPMALKA